MPIVEVKHMFNLPEERDEYEDFMIAPKFGPAMEEFNRFLKQKSDYVDAKADWPGDEEEKWGAPGYKVPPFDEAVACFIYAKCREKLWEILNDHGAVLNG